MMYKCVHCSKEKQLCECYSPFKIPDTLHDWPGQKRILRLMFELPETDWETINEYTERVNIANAMVMMIDKSLFEGDRSAPYSPLRIALRDARDAEESKRTAFFVQSFYGVPYHRHKGGK